MSFTIKLPDDRYLQIDVRNEIDDDANLAVDEIAEPEVDEPEPSRRGRRALRYAVAAGAVGGGFLAARQLRQRRRSSGSETETRIETKNAA